MKKLIKEECMACLNQFFEDTNYYVGYVICNNHNYEFDVLNQLIKEYFDPQPYKFEELEDGMWVWDDKLEICDQVILTRVCLDPKTEKTCKPFYVVTYAGEIEYEENRFFPLTKAYQERFISFD